VRESGLLALGALSSGCYGDMGTYLPHIFPFFLQSLADETPEIKSIACWVISRYCGWIFDYQHVDGDLAHRLFLEMINGLLKTMGDPRPKVQASCCSCICAVAETAGPELIPSLPAIFTHIGMAFGFYGVKNRLMLFDTIGTIAEVVGEAIADANYLQLFFPKVIEAFDALEDDNMHLFPVMECLSSVLGVIGLASQGYAQAIYFRCVRIIGSTLMAHNAKDAHDADDDDLPSKDFVVCGLDVLGSLCTGLEENFALLAESSKETLLQLLFACVRDSAPEVRQSAFAFAGELSKNAVSVLGTTTGQLIGACIDNFNPDAPLVANNAFWTVGELAVRIGGDPMGPFIPKIIHATVQLLHIPEHEIEQVLRQNIAITVGRLGVTNTAQVAEYLPEFFEQLCKALSLTQQSHEKDHAFAGLIKLVTAKPEVLFAPSSVGVVVNFIQACASWEDPPVEPLLTELGQILQVLKGNASLWKIATASLGRNTISHVSDMFRIA
jgi:transportin-1